MGTEEKAVDTYVQYEKIDEWVKRRRDLWQLCGQREDVIKSFFLDNIADISTEVDVLVETGNYEAVKSFNSISVNICCYTLSV